MQTLELTRLPGGLVRLVDSIPRKHLERAGYAKRHACGVGHGIGFSECVEERTATRLSDYRLAQRISVSLDVGISRNSEGLDGRFEDPYIIDRDGNPDRLTDVPVLPVIV